MPAKPESIDAYLAGVPADRRVALQQLRRTILAIVPRAQECISYSMPAFRHEGHVVAGFLATTQGCSYFPFSGTTLATLADDVRAYSQTKSALHFEPSKPLPKALVKKLITARLAEEVARAPAKKAAARAKKAAAPAKKAAGRTGKASTAGRATKRTRKLEAAGKRAAASAGRRAARPR